MQLEATDREHTYKCKVVDISEGQLFVDYPVHTITRRTEIFPIGTTFHSSFIQNNSVYSFFTEILAKQNIKDIPVLALAFQENSMKRIQRREHLRVETILDISVKSSSIAFHTVTADLSGGGVSVILQSDQVIQGGEQLDMMLVLPINGIIEYIHIIGTALRDREQKENTRRLSIRFDKVRSQDQQLIVRYCYLRQLADFKKEFNKGG